MMIFCFFLFCLNNMYLYQIIEERRYSSSDYLSYLVTTGVKNWESGVTDCPTSIDSYRISRNKEHDPD